MKESIINNVTGYLVEPDFSQIGYAMSKFVVKKKSAEIMGTIAQVEFVGKYSLMALGTALDKFIQKYYSNVVTPIDSLTDTSLSQMIYAKNEIYCKKKLSEQGLEKYV